MAINKRFGKHSQAANDFLEPKAVTGLTVTDVGTSRAYDNGAFNVSWTLPADSPAATSYDISTTPTTSTTNVLTTSGTITGLASNTSYTVTVVAKNAAGNSLSTTSTSVTATTVPQAPTIGTPTCATGQAYTGSANTSVPFTANATGGKAISGYTVTSSSSQTGTGASSPISVSTPVGSSYTYTVVATNANGNSAASTASGSVLSASVPQAISSVSASTPSAGVDRITFTAPATGGSAITNYYWTSSDGKSGNSGSTTIDISQEQGTAQYYNVYADNAYGRSVASPNSNTVTTTFSFVPFSFAPFGFSPFGFSPVVFGFSPFGFSPVVFGFSPVVFGFSPFGFSPVVFGFSPVVFGFSPSPSCIDQDTLIAVVSATDTVEYKAAKHIGVGDKVWSSQWDELIDESFSTPQDSPTSQLSNLHMVQTEIVAIQPSIKSTTVYFNNDTDIRFSLEENILVKRNNVFQFLSTSQVVVGDKFMKVDADGNYTELNVSSISYIDEDRTVYRFDAEPTDNLIAANLVVHNGKTFF